MSVAYLFRTCCLRLADNPSLCAAAERGYVLAGYALGDVPKKLGRASAWRLRCSLETLDVQLRQRGGCLFIGTGGLADTAIELARRAGNKEVYTAGDPTPQLAAAEKKATTECEKAGVRLRLTGSQLLHDPITMRNKQNKRYRVFAPFWRELDRMLQSDPPVTSDMPAEIRFINKGSGLGIDMVCAADFWKGTCNGSIGEIAARDRLTGFISDHIGSYATKRDLPAVTATSHLSAALRFGEISPVQIYVTTAKLGKAAKSFQRQLAWRDFSYHVLHQQPEMDRHNLRPEFDKFPWERDEKMITAWREACTGIPLVDAGMRELANTGHMHNRVRMITASLLVKNLLQDWRSGAEHFWAQLHDADLANNYFSWQWVAGCGLDAAPYFRIFNPVLQGHKFDPEGDYVRQHLPELAKLPTKYIFAPWDAPDKVLDAARVRLGKNYPLPVINLAESRVKALQALANTKNS